MKLFDKTAALDAASQDDSRAKKKSQPSTQDSSALSGSASPSDQEMQLSSGNKSSLEAAVSAFGLAVFAWDISTGETRFDGNWSSLLRGQSPKAKDIRGLLELLHPEDYGIIYLAFSDLMHGRLYSLEREARLDNQDSDIDQWVMIRANSTRNKQGEVTSIQGAILDITGYKATEQQAAEMMHHDLMTGLPNRQHLLARIEACQTPNDLVQDIRNLDIVVIDLDRFRIVNDSLGESVGDQVLRIIGERLKRQLRRGDMIARLGGDQFAFALLSPNKDENSHSKLLRRLEKLRTQISNPIHLDDSLTQGDPIILDANIGLRRSLTSEDISAENLLRDASLALRETKNSKTSHFTEYYDELHEKLVISVEYEKIIRQALIEDWVDVHYQPVIESHTGRPIGFEALARINHPKQGIIAPALFIPVAEETGLIREITRVIIKKALNQLAVWQSDHPNMADMTIAINLSPVQFEDEEILSDLKQGMADTGLSGDSIKIEITESLLIKNMKAAIKILDSLKEMGIQICIDDFGTGYSSLSYLRNYCFDTLKIDRSFIEHITREPRDAELVRSIVQMGQNVGMNIVVEGVEEQAQQNLLTKLGCHFVQGFLVAKPLPAIQASTWLNDYTAMAAD